MDKLELASPEIHNKAYEVMKKFHPDLWEAGVSLTVFFSRKLSTSGEFMDSEDSLVCRGGPALATIRLSKESEKALGSGDVVIVLDYSAYTNSLTEPERDSLFDHELAHLTTKRAIGVGLRKTHYGRPVLGIVQHEFEMGIFIEPILRHGINSTDYQAAEGLFRVVRTALIAHKKREAREEGKNRG